MRVERHTASDLVDLHEFGLNRYGPARGEVYELRERHRWVTSFRDRDGDYWYVRTEPVNGSLTSVSVIADPSNRNLLNAIATSILPGQANLLNPEADGVLFSIIETAARAFEEEGRQSPGPSGSSDEERGGSGSGVMISELGHIVTNYHVVEGCRALSANGAAVTVEKVSEDHDLALLAPVNGFSLLLGRPTASLAVDAAELNQDITVAGYPMGGALGGINVTRGSVSSRQGPGGDEDLFQFTAAIQPGNYGGPILDATGQVVGLVVAKMDDQFFADASGVLPQDISFGISRRAVADFIRNVPGIESPGWFSASRAGRSLSNTELARHAEAVTYLIECE